MKKLLLAGMIIGMAVVAKAGNFPENPDKRTSIGISAGANTLKGDGTVKFFFGSFSQDGKQDSKNISADLRLPISSNATITFGAGYMTGTSEFSETNMLAGSTTEMDGFGFQIGMRFYLQ